MTKKELNKYKKEYLEEVQILKSLKIGDRVYVTDAYYDFFECEIISIDMKNHKVKVIDHSYLEKPVKILKIGSFYTKKKAEEIWKTDEFKYKMF